MELSFQEKSAWGLLIGITIVSFFYFPAAFEIAGRVSHGAALIVVSVVGVIALVIIEAIYHAVIAVSSNGGQTDERDRLFDLKAERNASIVLGVGLFSLVGHIILSNSIKAMAPIGGLTIAVWILFALTISEIAKLVSQIWFYRFGG